MSEMIERIAKAIKAKAWAIDLPLRDEECSEIARAAIEAMREPTNAMMFAPPDVQFGPADAEFVWHCMIDEALRNMPGVKTFNTDP